MGSSQSESFQFLSNEDISKFNGIFPQIIYEALGFLDFPSSPPSLIKHYEQLVAHKIRGGSKIRAEMVILGYKYFSTDLSLQSIRLSYVLGWIVEILHSSTTIGYTGPGHLQHCWCGQYSADHPTVNDSNFLKNAGFLLANKYFGDKPYYSEIVNLFHHAFLQTFIGHGMKPMSGNLKDHLNSPIFDMAFYEGVAEYNSINTFYIPVAVAMIMAGINNQEAYNSVNRVTRKIGIYFQAQEDYLDVFGPPKQMGRSCTSVAIGEYTWPIVTAVMRSSVLHLNMLIDNYGYLNTFKISVVRTIFERLNIKNMYWNYEYQVRQRVTAEIENTNEIPKGLFNTIMVALLARWP